MAGCEQVSPTTSTASQNAPTPPNFSTSYVLPEGFGLAETGEEDSLGRPVYVKCSTCHDADARSERVFKQTADEIEEVHVGLVFAHGNLTCLSCHHPTDRDRLRLADETSIAFSEVTDLCGQCHGTVRRNYDRGAHGGMNGYWDLSRGPRTRNACVVCHDPHSPAQTKVLPAPPPPRPAGTTP